MSDIALTWEATAGACDLSVYSNDLLHEDGIRTAILLSLFTDSRSEDGDTLPSGETDRRGWWGDAFPVADDDRIGSKLWLLARSKQTADILSRAEEYARAALKWLLDDNVAARVDVACEFLTPQRGLGLSVTVIRPNTDPVKFRFNQVWSAEEARI